MPIFSGIAKLGGAMITADANKEAARLQTDAIREAQTKQLAFAREGQDYLKEAIKGEEPGVSYLNRVVAESGELTPAQRTQLDEARREVRNQINTSAIAGSGRTAAALIKKTESDFTNDALERNRGRALEVASGMGSRAGSYKTGVGNISVGTGTQQAAMQQAIGNTQGNAAAATGKVWGETLGSIGGDISSAMKKSKYEDYGNVAGLSSFLSTVAA